MTSIWRHIESSQKPENACTSQLFWSINLKFIIGKSHESEIYEVKKTNTSDSLSSFWNCKIWWKRIRGLIFTFFTERLFLINLSFFFNCRGQIIHMSGVLSHFPGSWTSFITGRNTDIWRQTDSYNWCLYWSGIWRRWWSTQKYLFHFTDINGSYDQFHWPYVLNRESILENEISICLK